MKIENGKKELELGYESIKFRISEEFQTKAMWALINLYRDKIGTPVKEIISNARDANRDNNKEDHDIDIHLDNRYLTVRDYGKGMDENLVNEILTNFGASTKSKDNTKTGGFGIGFKSPLCKVSQFHFLTWVNGLEYKYIVAKNGDTLAVSMVYKKPSNEHTGVQVFLPIVNIKEEIELYKIAVFKTVAFWDNLPRFNYEIPKLERVDFKSHSRFTKDSLSLIGFGNSLYTWDSNNTRVIFLIDGLPYLFDVKVKDQISTIVLKFNTGEIKIHETRERLEPTENELNNILHKISNAINEESKILNSLNLKTYLTYYKFFKSINYQSDVYNLRGDRVTFKLESYYFAKSYRYKGVDKVKKANDPSAKIGQEIFFVPDTESLNNARRKAIAYCNKTKLSTAITQVKNSDLELLLKYRDINELPMPEKIARQKVESSEINLKHCRVGYDTTESIYKSDLPSKKNYLYLDYNAETNKDMVLFVDSLGYRLIKLSKDNQTLVEKYSGFQKLDTFLANFTLTKNIIDDYFASKLTHVKKDLIKLDSNDSDISEYRKLSEKILEYKSVAKDYRLLDKYLQELNAKYYPEIKTMNEKITELEKSIEKRFPLIYTAIEKGSEVTQDYINAMIQFEKGKN